MALAALNSVNRMVITQLLKDPYIYGDETVQNKMRAFMTQARKIDSEKLDYVDILDVLTEYNEDQYEDEDVLGDAVEAFDDLFSSLMDEETQALHLQYGDEVSEHFLFSKTNIFKAFGFRTVQQTGCLKCGQVSYQLAHHLNLNVCDATDEGVSFLGPVVLSEFFKKGNEKTINEIIQENKSLFARLIDKLCGCFRVDESLYLEQQRRDYEEAQHRIDLNLREEFEKEENEGMQDTQKIELLKTEESGRDEAKKEKKRKRRQQRE